MAVFFCERYPQLKVLDPRAPNKELARFHNGFFETEDAFVIAELSKRDYLARQDDGPVRPVVTEETSEPSTLPPGPDKTELLTALVDQALEAGVLKLRGSRIFYHQRKVGDTHQNAVHNLRVDPKLAEQIAEALDKTRGA